MTKADESTMVSEKMGFFGGERKLEVDRALKRVLCVIREEKLSITQAEYLAQCLSTEIKKAERTLLSNTEME